MSTSTAKITVNPFLRTRVDEKVDIIVSNLSPEQNIILRARTIDDNSRTFQTLAKYKANHDGEVLVSSQPSLGGSYTGVEPMGLFWSLQPVLKPDQDNVIRIQNVTTPLKITIDVSNDYEFCEDETKEGDKLASVTVERCFMAAGVTRHFVEGEGFYGTLFLPPGDGCFPGVVDLWGRPGGIREDRAALLASNGFASLALAFCGFKDLPEKYTPLEHAYFEKAVDWLIDHPKVISSGVGLLGLSLGGTLALAIASQIPEKIKAVVSISGTHVLIGGTLKCESSTVQGYPVELIGPGYVPYSHFLSLFKSKLACEPDSPAIVPVERITCPVLLVYGLSDELNPEIQWMVNEVFDRMAKHGKASLCRRLGLPGTGHFLIPCFLPQGSRHYVKKYDDIWLLGGEYDTMAKGSEICWKESLALLRENIH